MTISRGYWITGKVGGCLKACTPFVKVENGHLTIKFDETSMLLFRHNVPGILRDTSVENFSFKVQHEPTGNDR